MTTINVSAGQRTAIIRRAFSSVPMNYQFNAKSAVDGEALSGHIEVRKSSWIIPGTPQTLPLQESNEVSAGLWNTFMSVDVIPNVDAVITTSGRNIRNRRVILLLGFLIIAVAAAMLIIFRP